MNSEILSLLLNNFGKYTPISDQALAFLNDHFHVKTYDPKEIIVEGGSIARYFYFVLDGVQVIYLLNAKGEKVTLGFSFNGSVSGVYDSFLKQAPSNYFLESLTPSQMIGISRERYLALFDQFPEFYQWRTQFMEEILFGRSAREVEMLTLSAKERFDTFNKRCPPALLKIPQKYLASYLNMTPETYSRLRAMK